MVTPSIRFRADASPVLGTGHVMRCLTLADALAARGADIAFVSAPGTAETVPALPYPILSPDRPPFGADLVVVDHYGIDAAEEARLRAQNRAVMAIDDLPTRRHHCDLLLDQTFGRGADEYTALVPNTASVLAGSDFALLRPQFAAARQASLARRGTGELRRLLIGLGGSDPDDVTSAVLDAVAKSGLDLALDVVMGAAAPHLEAVRTKAAALPDARVHVGVADMAGLMSRADLAVGAAGTSTWERCCLGLPTLMLVIADNQRDVARLVCDAGAARRVTPENLPEALRDVAPDLPALSAAAARLCDGRGAERVLAALRRLPSLKDLPS